MAVYANPAAKSLIETDESGDPAAVIDLTEARPPSGYVDRHGHWVDLSARRRDLVSLDRWRTRDPEITAGRREKDEQRARIAANECTDSTAELARRLACQALGADPDTGEMLTPTLELERGVSAGQTPKPVSCEVERKNSQLTDSEPCTGWQATRIDADGTVTLVGVECKRIACPICGRMKADALRRELEVGFADAVELVVVELEPTDAKALRNLKDRLRDHRATAHTMRTPEGLVRVVHTPVKTRRKLGRSMPAADALALVGTALDARTGHTDTGRVDWSGPGADLVKASRAKPPKREPDDGVIWGVTSVPIVEAAKVADDLGATVRADSVHNVWQIGGLSPVTRDELLRRIGFRSMAELAETRSRKQIERELAKAKRKLRERRDTERKACALATRRLGDAGMLATPRGGVA